jgi:DNA repair protein RadC
VLRCLALVRGAMLNVLAADLADTPLLNDGAAVTDYLHVAMAHEPREQVRALFLDASLRLIRDEVLGTGSITAAPVYPREIMRRALELGATGLILAHNHPSGNREPSRSDIQITRQLAEAGRALDIKLHDHLIITRTGHTSLRELGHV